MRVLFPENPMNKAEADEPYHEEFVAARDAGYACSLFDFDALRFGEFKPRPRIEVGERVLYRGWMLNPSGYGTLTTQIERNDGKPITSVSDYLKCHHLPGWYRKCSKLTTETHFFDIGDGDIRDSLTQGIHTLGWEQYFVKDYVKSNTANKGSIANSVSEIIEIVEQIQLYRGEIEGGIAIRRVENYLEDTERRYFVVKGRPYSVDDDIPAIVDEVAALIDAQFYSIDIIRNTSGDSRLVELGDGQVSDKKNWPLGKFMEIIAANA